MRKVFTRSVGDLFSALNIGSRELVSLVGGGGKTSLLFALADELLQRKRKVVTTTTTKMGQGEARRSPCFITTESQIPWQDELLTGLHEHGHVFLARGLQDSGKVEGVNTSLANEIFQREEIDYIIVEADGSSGCPVKAPAEHEPVIPSSSTIVVAMLGLESIGAPMGPQIVFRMDRFAELTGTKPGQRITPTVLSRLLLAPEGLFKGAPLASKKIVFLNKRDLSLESAEAEKLADLVLGEKSNRVDQVVIGSIMEGEYVVIRHRA